MTESNQQGPERELLDIVRSINDACLAGSGFSDLEKHFHEQVVLVAPGFSRKLEGREACLKTYEDACVQMTFHKMDMSDEQVDIYGSSAVVTYKYDCTWEHQGKRLDEDGREILAFTRDDQGWRIVWRTLLPGSRRSGAATQSEADSGKMDEETSAPLGSATSATELQKHCVDLIERCAVCQLTTLDEQGFPHTTAMNNLRNPKLYPSVVPIVEEEGEAFLLYLSTHMDSYKVARIQENPRVSVYFCDDDRFQGLMLGGDIEIVQDQDLKARLWQEGWNLYYPSGPKGPEYGILRLKPVMAKGWYQAGPFDLKLV